MSIDPLEPCEIPLEMRETMLATQSIPNQGIECQPQCQSSTHSQDVPSFRAALAPIIFEVNANTTQRHH